MGWIRIDDGFADHPKVVAAGPAAAWLYVCGLIYCARFLTDGFIPRSQVRKLTSDHNALRLGSKLAQIGLWEECPDGYRVHDYLDWQTSAAHVHAEREAARQRAKRSAERRHAAPAAAAQPQRSRGAASPKVRELEVEVELNPPTPHDAAPQNGRRPAARSATPRGRSQPVTTSTQDPEHPAVIAQRRRDAEPCPTCHRDRFVPDPDNPGRMRQCPTCDATGVAPAVAR